jgi:chromate transporter
VNTGLLVSLAVTFASLSLVSIGGANALLPELHRQVVTARGWMTDPTFADLFAVSQVAPGPNILLVSLIGWQVAGGAGMLVATIAVMLPSSVLALIIGRIVNRCSAQSWMLIAKAGLVPIALGLILSSGVVTARAADHTLLSVAITAVTAAFVIGIRRNPLWAMALSAAAGVAFR